MNFTNFFEPVRIGCNLNILRIATRIENYSSFIINTNNTNNTSNANNSNENIENVNIESESDESDDDDRLCSICQQNYNSPDILRIINHCSHYYHQHCLDQWLENNTKCPECQYDLRDTRPIATSTPNPIINNNIPNDIPDLINDIPNPITSNQSPESILTFLLSNSSPQPPRQPSTQIPAQPSISRNQRLNSFFQDILNENPHEINERVIDVEYYMHSPLYTQPPRQPPRQPTTNQSNTPLSNHSIFSNLLNTPSTNTTPQQPTRRTNTTPQQPRTERETVNNMLEQYNSLNRIQSQLERILNLRTEELRNIRRQPRQPRQPQQPRQTHQIPRRAPPSPPSQQSLREARGVQGVLEARQFRQTPQQIQILRENYEEDDTTDTTNEEDISIDINFDREIQLLNEKVKTLEKNEKANKIQLRKLNIANQNNNEKIKNLDIHINDITTELKEIKDKLKSQPNVNNNDNNDNNNLKLNITHLNLTEEVKPIKEKEKSHSRFKFWKK